MSLPHYTDLDLKDNDILNALTGIVATSGTVLGTDSIRTAISKLMGAIATGLLNYNVVANTVYSTTSLTDVLLTGMSVTPVAGTYLVLFDANIALTTNNSIASFTFYKNAVAVPDTLRNVQASGGSWVGTADIGTVVSLNGTDVLTVQNKITSGTLTVNGRSLALLRLGA